MNPATHLRSGLLRRLARGETRFSSRVVVGNASSMVLTSLVTSGLGFVFWWVAARQFAALDVGIAAAAVSASQFLGSLSVLGFGTLLISELPTASPAKRTAFLSTALCIAGCVGVLLGLAFSMVGPAFVVELRPIRESWPLTGLFAIAVSGTAIGFILDQVAVGSLQSRLQLARNTVYSLAKLGVLLAATRLVAGDTALIIFATWPLGNAISLALLIRLLATRESGFSLGRPHPSLVRRLSGAAIGHHALNMSLQGPSLILPVLVTIALSATANAYFYTAWMAANVAVLPQIALATTLFAVGVRERFVLVQKTRLTLCLGLCAAVGAYTILFFAGDWMLGVFGKAYAEEASIALRILALAVFPLLIKNHCVVLFRIERRIRAGAIAAAGGALVEIAGAAIGGWQGGLEGLCAGWLAALSVEALCMLPAVLRAAGWAPTRRLACAS
jgi:O-antigen/teichoic acid export membrane protein